MLDISDNFGQPINPVDLFDYEDMLLNDIASTSTTMNYVETAVQKAQDIDVHDGMIAPEPTETLQELIKGLKAKLF